MLSKAGQQVHTYLTVADAAIENSDCVLMQGALQDAALCGRDSHDWYNRDSGTCSRSPLQTRVVMDPLLDVDTARPDASRTKLSVTTPCGSGAIDRDWHRHTRRVGRFFQIAAIDSALELMRAEYSCLTPDLCRFRSP